MTTELEIWRDTPSLPPGYQASNWGRVRSWRKPGRARERFREAPRFRKVVPNSKSGHSTMMFVVDGKYVSRYVHHLVLEAFGIPRTGTEVRHLNGKDFDNHLKNLCWGTRRENVADQRKHGTWAYGEKNAGAKLTNARADQIRRSRQKGCVLAKANHVSQATISRIRHGARYVA